MTPDEVIKAVLDADTRHMVVLVHRDWTLSERHVATIPDGAMVLCTETSTFVRKAVVRRMVRCTFFEEQA